MASKQNLELLAGTAAGDEAPVSPGAQEESSASCAARATATAYVDYLQADAAASAAVNQAPGAVNALLQNPTLLQHLGVNAGTAAHILHSLVNSNSQRIPNASEIQQMLSQLQQQQQVCVPQQPQQGTLHQPQSTQQQQAMLAELIKVNSGAAGNQINAQLLASQFGVRAPTGNRVLPSPNAAQAATARDATQMPPPGPRLAMSHDYSEEHVNPEERQSQKRAANRKSAQLSRKRKKQFMEDLKAENDALRRKEQILRSIPDLVLVFDSAGKILFVSESVHNFVPATSTELTGQSLWQHLCDESVRLLKAAFMDALAANSDDSNSAPLGSGLWEINLMEGKDGAKKLVLLNGIVHFEGDRPECVCTIRPAEAASEESKAKSWWKVSTGQSVVRGREKSTISGSSVSNSGGSNTGSDDGSEEAVAVSAS